MSVISNSNFKWLLMLQDCKECKARTTELSKEYNSEYMHMAAVPLVRPPLC